MQIRGFLLEHQVEERIDLCHKRFLLDSNSERKNYNPTAAAIREEIERLGPISFARFMELALYHPDHGYYNRDAPIIGKSGDFFTSVSVGSLFGEMLAFWLARELEKIPGTLQIVEAGAHDGTLAGYIFSWLRNYRPDFAARVQYWIIEPSSRLENLQRQTLKDHPGVQWDKSIKELGTIAGAIISNELLDAFPVQVLEWRDGWRELGVCMNGNQFDWLPLDQLSECSKDALSELKELEPHLPQGFRVEFSPAAEKWWRTAAANLEEGLLLAVDYGDESAGLWAKGGSTLRSPRGHGVVAKVLANP